MIMEIADLLDRVNVLQPARPLVCRVLARVIFGIGSYKDERRLLVNLSNKSESVIPPECESQIWEWVRELMWNRAVSTGYWRALGCLIYTRDLADVALKYEISQTDLVYLFNQLDQTDIDEFIDQNRDWRSPSIDDKTVREILALCKSTINACVWRLRFIWQYDVSHPKEEWDSWFVSEALQTIYRYEDRHSLNHLVNTIKQALKMKCGVMQQRYATVKKGALIDTALVNKDKRRKFKGTADEKRKEAESESTRQQFVSRRAALMLDGPTGQSENPELFSRSTRSEPEIDTILFIAQVERESKQLARYLKLVVLEDDDDEFNCWIDENDAPVNSNTDLCKSAAVFCQLKQVDLDQLRAITEADYPIGQQIRERESELQMQAIDRRNQRKLAHV